ncbi:flagellar biosynthesis, cell-distal portion of basal-body rod [Klebsiella pneumoniae]|nr:flagellar biosynthesis, cell-distal portion of basal-body rod [Klebsiella pneumoniae]
MAFNPELGSTSPAVLLDNAERLDKLVNGPELTEPDRAGVELDTWRGMMAKNDQVTEDARKSITALGLPYSGFDPRLIPSHSQSALSNSLK